MERADAVVIGGGVMGTSIAFHLARQRFGRVTLLEKGAICSGTSGKSSAIVRTHYTTPPSARMALLARRMPAAAEAGIAGGWSGMCEITPDWNPILGSAREVRGLHYCVGVSGHDFKLAPADSRLDGRPGADEDRLGRGWVAGPP